MTPRPAAERIAAQCSRTLSGRMCSGAVYGSCSTIYRPASGGNATIADMELSTPQCLLLALLHSLVEGDIMCAALLADITFSIEKLRSKHYSLWLQEDFVFPRSDIQKAIALLHELVANSIVKLPHHVMVTIISLGKKYGMEDVQLGNLSQDWPNDLAYQLENAVANNNPGDIVAIATRGGDINGYTQFGERLIHLATRSGSCASIAALSLMKADLEVMNSRNNTPLFEAIIHDQGPLVKALLTAGAKFDHRFFRGDTYLHLAAAGGYNGALKALLEAGMEVNEKNHFEETPLILALKAGKVRSVETLLEKGADSSILAEDMIITEFILETQNSDILGVLIRNGVNLKFHCGNTILHLLAELGNTEMIKVIKNIKLLENIKNKKGLTPLHVASNPFVIKYFIDMGFDVNIKTNKCATALHLASAKGSIELVTALIEHGATVDFQNEVGMSALMVALKNAKLGIVKFLLQKGADPNIQDKKGWTPLHYAATNKKSCNESVRVLLDAEVKVNVQDNLGRTALHCAALYGHIAAVTALLNAGEMVDLKDKDKWTPLHSAAGFGHLEVVTALMDHGASIAPKTKEGATALIIASVAGHLEVVQLLVDKGAPLNVRCNEGKTALYWASDRNHTAVADYLRSIGGV